MRNAIGVDLGSTFSSFAIFDESEGTVKTVGARSGENAGSIPSIVTKSDDEYSFGFDAIEEAVYNPDAVKFEAFKMLLPERRLDILQQYQYCPEGNHADSPADITGRFLDYHIKNIIKNEFPEKRLDQLTICVPQSWKAGKEKGDARSIVLGLCKTLDCFQGDAEGKVTVVSEPVAASAYFMYELFRDSSFNGYNLVVDYGGGTLDVTLNMVEMKEEASGKKEIRIVTIKDYGAGENHDDGKIGSAGITYIKKLASLAIEELPFNQKQFDRFVSLITKRLKEADVMEDIEDTLREIDDDNKLSALEKNNKEVFRARYGKTDISITYHLLASAYRQEIEPVLEDILNKIKNFMRLNHIPFESSNGDFKIAIAGGFGTFGLVEYHVMKAFQIQNKKDKRLINLSKAQRECAIAKGAALLANKKVELINTARYGIGIQSQAAGRGTVIRYAFDAGDRLEPGKIYYIPKEEKNKARFDLEDKDKVQYMNSDQSIKSLFYGFDKGNTSTEVKLMGDMKKKFSSFNIGRAHYGFSIDSSEIFYFHVEYLDIRTANGDYVRDRIELDDLIGYGVKEID